MTVYDIGDGAEVEFVDGVVHIRGKPPYANFRISLKDEDAKTLHSYLNKEFGPLPVRVADDVPVKPKKKKVTKDEEKED